MSRPPWQIAAELNAILPELLPHYERCEHDDLPVLIGRSNIFRQTVRAGMRFARDPDICLHLSGDPGRGKSTFAKFFHFTGPKAQHKFVACNIAERSAELLASELFGHKRGSFTGAARDHQGFIAQAGVGTLFLDEVGDLNHTLQIKLLRALEERRYRPVGASDEEKARCSFITASWRELGNQNLFRHDFVSRLGGILELPALTERRDDIELLVRFFAALKNRCSVSANAITMLKQHPPDGDVRALNQIVRAAVGIAQDRTGEDLCKVNIRDMRQSLERATHTTAKREPAQPLSQIAQALTDKQGWWSPQDLVERSAHSRHAVTRTLRRWEQRSWVVSYGRTHHCLYRWIGSNVHPAGEHVLFASYLTHVSGGHWDYRDYRKHARSKSRTSFRRFLLSLQDHDGFRQIDDPHPRFVFSEG